MNVEKSFLNGERFTPLTILSFSRTASGDRSGANLDCGGEAAASTCSCCSASSSSRAGEDDEWYSGGADVALRDDLRVVAEALGAAALRVRGFGGGRAGEEDSAPDWKTLLSSHPLSSPNCDHSEYKKGGSSGNASHLRIGGYVNQRHQPDGSLITDRWER